MLRTLFLSEFPIKVKMYIHIYKKLKLIFIFISRNLSGAHSLASGSGAKSVNKEIRFIEIGE